MRIHGAAGVLTKKTASRRVQAISPFRIPKRNDRNKVRKRRRERTRIYTARELSKKQALVNLFTPLPEAGGRRSQWQASAIGANIQKNEARGRSCLLGYLFQTAFS